MLNKIILVIISFILALSIDYFKERKKVISIFLFILLIVILSLAFSYREYFFNETIGNDYYSYKKWFETINFQNLLLSYKNFGFNLLIAIVKLFSSDFHIFLFFCSLIINGLTLLFIKDNSSDFSFAVFIYVCMFYFSSLNIMRQWLACAIFLYSFKYIFEKKAIKYYILIFISSLFHDSAILLFILYIILNFKSEFWKKELLLILIGIIMFVYYNEIVLLILTFTENIGLGYLTKYGYIDPTFEIGNYTSFIILLLLLAILNLKTLRGKTVYKEKQYIVLVSLSLIFSLLKTTNLIFARISVYFFSFLIITLPLVTDIFQKRSRILVKLFICSLLLFSFIN